LRPDVAPALERALIEDHRHVLFVEDSSVPVQPLVKLGQIVLTTSNTGSALNASGLSSDVEEAVLEMIERLRRAGVFLDQTAVDAGEGI
jgi:hypothetical protein